MNQQRLGGPRPGLITRLVAGVAGVVVLAGAFVVGVVAWIFLAGFLLIGGVVLSIWVWRQRRHFEKFQRQTDDSIIDVEYEVLSEAQAPQEKTRNP